MLGVLEYYDPYLGGHSRRVGFLAGEIARELNLPNQEVTAAQMGGLLHDVGIIALTKRLRDARFSELAQEEIEIVKQQTVYAEEIISPSEELRKVGSIVRSHLERLDGSGFPDALRAEEIPLAARIIAVSNAYDELIHRRRFTPAPLATQKEKDDYAFAHLAAHADRHFQKNIVEALQLVVKKLAINAKAIAKVGIGDLKQGMILADDIYGTDGLLVLAKGQALSPIQIRRLAMYCGMKMIAQPLLIVKE